MALRLKDSDIFGAGPVTEGRRTDRDSKPLRLTDEDIFGRDDAPTTTRVRGGLDTRDLALRQAEREAERQPEIVPEFETDIPTDRAMMNLEPSLQAQKVAPRIGGMADPDANPPAPQDDWGTLVRKAFQNVGSMFERQAGGMLRQEANAPFTPGGTMGVAFAGEQFGEQVAPEETEARFEMARPLDDLGRAIFDEATADMARNAPDLRESSIKNYAYQIAVSTMNMAPTLAVGAVTRQPGVALSVMGGQVYGESYAEALDRGATEQGARFDAAFRTAAEILPETLPLGILYDRLGKGLLPKLFAVPAAEAGSEVLTEALNIGYDTGVLDEDMTWGEVQKRLVDAGIVGAGMGGGMVLAEAGTQAVAGAFNRDDDKPGQPAVTVELADGTASTVPQGSAPAADPLTPEDHASPIPDSLIAEGKQVIADATATAAATDILARNTLPPVGSRVSVTFPDGRTGAGTILDAFTNEESELGIAGDGVRIQMDDGTVVDEFVSGPSASGVKIAPEAAASVEQEASHKNPGADGDSMGGSMGPAPGAPPVPPARPGGMLAGQPQGDLGQPGAGAQMGAGIAGAIGENLRETLWQAYSTGQGAGMIDPLVKRARSEAPGMSRDEFVAWAEAVTAGQTPPPRIRGQEGAPAATDPDDLSFDRFREALPVDADGSPDIAGRGREIMEQVANVSLWGRMTDDQKREALRIAREGARNPAPDGANNAPPAGAAPVSSEAASENQAGEGIIGSGAPGESWRQPVGINQLYLENPAAYQRALDLNRRLPNATDPAEIAAIRAEIRQIERGEWRDPNVRRAEPAGEQPAGVTLGQLVDEADATAPAPTPTGPLFAPYGTAQQQKRILDRAAKKIDGAKVVKAGLTGRWHMELPRDASPETRAAAEAEVERQANITVAKSERARQSASERDTGPEDVLTFLANRGGIRDDEGHGLRQKRNLQRPVVGAGSLIRDGGMSIDAAAEILWEAGFFGPMESVDRPGEREVLDLIERAADSRVYTPEDEIEVRRREAEKAEAEGAAREDELRTFIKAEGKRLGEVFSETDIDAIRQIMVADGLDAEAAVVEYAERLAMQANDAAQEETGDDEFDVPFDAPQGDDRADGPDRSASEDERGDEGEGEARPPAPAEDRGREGEVTPADLSRLAARFADREATEAEEATLRESVRGGWRIPDEIAQRLFDESQEIMRALPSNIGKAIQEGRLSTYKLALHARLNRIERVFPNTSDQWQEIYRQARADAEARGAEEDAERRKVAEKMVADYGFKVGDRVYRVLASFIPIVSPGRRLEGTVKISKRGVAYVAADGQQFTLDGWTKVEESAAPAAPTGPRVIVNVVGRDGKTDAERGGPLPTEAPAPNMLVSDDRMAELKKRLRDKLNNQASAGIDPELMAIGAEIAVGHIERGVRKFAAFARAMIEDLGDAARPYLKMWYNAARDWPGFDNQGMDAYDVVAGIDPNGDFAEVAPDTAEPGVVLADRLSVLIETGEEITARRLFDMGAEAYGGTVAEGRFTPKDAYDALELAINEAVRRMDVNPAVSMDEAQGRVADLQAILDRIPTQTRRTAETDAFQQFSTPPHYAYAVNWVANIGAGDTVLEPSAGVGGIAVYALNADARAVYGNELSPRRAALLRDLGLTEVFTEDAEHLNAILPARVAPTVVVMNPPFSQTGGRMGGKKVIDTGAKHIEQALKRLRPGGRLVAITGRGMAFDRPAFRGWWDRIGKEYDVRANVSVGGDVYRKYGTTFETQILVIDKAAPSGRAPVTGDAATIPDLLRLLEGVRNERTPATAGSEPRPDLRGVSGAPDEGGAGRPDAVGAVPAPTDAVGRDDGRGGDRPDARGEPGAPDRGPDAAAAGEGAGLAPVPGGNEAATGAPTAGARGGGARGGRAGAARPARGQAGGNDRLDAAEERADRGLDLEAVDQAARGEITEEVYESYRPARVRVKGAKPHPTELVESAAMASVTPPPADYSPKLPARLIEGGILSEAQLEAIVYAGQAHQGTLPEGMRRGFFIGDGTGVGKGREISGILMDNWQQGRRKHVWVSKNRKLIEDARRDWAALGGNPDDIIELGKIKLGSPVAAERGIVFVPYDTLKTGANLRREGAGRNLRSRIDQILDWVGDDFDGVMAFDEAHLMGNAVAIKGKRGMSKPSSRALAGVDIQTALPQARVVYASATGATDIVNLAYAERLGLWGRGTPFATKHMFINEISGGGVAAMELVARDLKALGLYIARGLSFRGVEQMRLTHTLTPEQRTMYDSLAKAWQGVLANVHAAMEDAGSKKNGQARSAALSAFWSSHQRFFNATLTALQMPSVLRQMEQDMADGHAVVVQLVNTNEAAQERAAAEIADEDDITSLDMSPMTVLLQYVERSFPVAQYEEYLDDNQNVRTRPVLDSAGNVVENPEAVARRERLLTELGALRAPEPPLEQIIDRFGTAQVAEVTGRQRRFVRQDDGSLVPERRGDRANKADIDAFQGDKKRVLVFSDAGGTGASYHADRTAKNQRRRMHYLVQAGWRADAAVQGFGRSHRSNQAVAPLFRLVDTDLKGHKRFISTIARRLDQLGALTKGERQAGGQGMFTEADNLESSHAGEAIEQFIFDVYRGKVDDISMADIETEMGLALIDGNTGALNQDKLPEVPQFLNRLLSLTIERQDRFFDEFYTRFVNIIEAARERGELDTGTETIKADSIQKISDRVVYTDERSGAETRYVKLNKRQRIDYISFADAVEKGNGFVRNVRSGRVWVRGATYSVTDRNTGAVTDLVRLQGHDPRSRQSVPVADLSDPEKWVDMPEAEAAAEWQKAIDEAPEFREEDIHLITGSILPIWDRLEGKPRIYRLATDDGERFLGREIEPAKVDATLSRLGLDPDKPNLTPEQAVQRVVEGNWRLTLANGWIVRRSLVGGEQRIEIEGPTPRDIDALVREGAMTERIQFRTRFFLPTGDNAAAVMGEVIKYRPIASAAQPSRAAAAALMSGRGGRLPDQDDGPQFSIRQRPQTQSEAFRRWFGDSKVVDEDGRPLVVYHGTSTDFDAFVPGSHFGTARSANERLRDRGQSQGARVLPVYLRIENPLRVTDQEASDEATFLNAIKRGKYPDLDLNTALRKGAMRAAERAGYDGFIYRNRLEDRGKDSYVAFEPEQVKSATGNDGTFDPANPDIRFGARDAAGRVRRAPSINVLPNREVSAAFPQVAEAMRQRLRDLGVSDKVAVKLVDVIRADVDGRTGEMDGMYARGTGLIEVAMDGDRITFTFHHETIHALRDSTLWGMPYGVFREAEWKKLTAAVRADKARMAEIRRRYGHLSEEAQMEEAIADMFGEWASGRAEVGGFLRTAFERIRAILMAIADAFSSQGFGSVESIFEGIERGVVGRRRDSRGRFVADPMRFVDEAGPMGIAAKFMAAAWHGTPHDFDRFSTAYMGTGEGAQAYGWGLYFAGKEGVARHYRDALAGNRMEVTFPGEAPERVKWDDDRYGDAIPYLSATKGDIEAAILNVRAGDGERWVAHYMRFYSSEIEDYEGWEPMIRDLYQGTSNYVEDEDGNYDPETSDVTMRYEVGTIDRSFTVTGSDWSGSWYVEDDDFGGGMGPYKSQRDAEDAIMETVRAEARLVRVAMALDDLQERGATVKASPGALFKVNLVPAEDEYLLWDKPLSEQSEKVKAALGRMFDDDGPMDAVNGLLEDGNQNPVERDDDAVTGADLYRILTTADRREGIVGEWVNPEDFRDGMIPEDSQHVVSIFLNKLGIPGIKYLDGGSRRDGDGSYNYVIFDDSLVEIEAKFSFRRKADAEREAQAATDRTGFVHDIVPMHGGAPDEGPTGWAISTTYIPVEAMGEELTPEQLAAREKFHAMRPQSFPKPYSKEAMTFGGTWKKMRRWATWDAEPGPTPAPVPVKAMAVVYEARERAEETGGEDGRRKAEQLVLLEEGEPYATETVDTVDGPREQLVIPGAEQAAVAPAGKPKPGQKSTAGLPLFGGEAEFAGERQGTLFSMRPPKPQQTSNASTPDPTFDSAQTEARWQDARKGIAGHESLKTRTVEWLDHIRAGFTRHFIDLPNVPGYADLAEQLRKLQAAPTASKEQVVRILRHLTEGMDAADLDLFTRKVVLDDLAWEASQDHDLPFGMTAEDVTRERAKVDRILMDRPDITHAVRQRKMIVRAVSQQLVDAGVLTRESVQNPAYYRHMVLDYARAEVMASKVKGTGKRLRTPHWARRMGSALDINANLLEAEFDWLNKAFMDIAAANTIGWIKTSRHNVRADVIARAKAHNTAGVQRALLKDLRENGFPKGEDRETGEILMSSPMNEVWKGFSQRIAIGLRRVRDSIDEAKVPAWLAGSLDRLMDMDDGDGSSIFPLLSHLMDHDLPGAQGAAMVFKAVTDRKAWVRNLLGDDYADTANVGSLVKRFAPEGYVAWQPDEGKILFLAKTLPEKVIERMLDKVAAEGGGGMSAAELTAALDSLRSVMVVGGPKYEMVIPEEVAATLNSIGSGREDDLFEAVLAEPMRWWKRWVLINPRRVIKYNLNNLSGDLDAVIAGNPKALRRMPEAVAELWRVMHKGEAPSARYREAVERGVFDSGLTVQEIPDINFMSEFEHLIDRSQARRPGRFALSGLMTVWRALQRYTQFRENWARYAAYLDYADRIEAGETAAQIGYGAAKPEIVEAIADPRDKAAYLARQLVGDYGAISHNGEWLRSHLIPFWSWVEINTRRYWRLNANAWGQGVGKGLRTGAVTGALLGARTTTYLTLRMALLYGMVTLWNNLLFPDEEDELADEERVRLHLNLGRDRDGEIRTIRFQGAFSDFLGWVGFEDAVAALLEVERGRGSAGDVVNAMAKAPVNRIVGGITPMIGVPVETLTGLSFWPDMFNPRPIRDGWRNLFQTFSLENEYDLVAGKPSRGYLRSWREGVISTRDAGENAYNRIRTAGYDWINEERGTEGISAASTPRSDALYEWRLALRYGDDEAARRALATMTELGMTADDRRESIKRAHPLGMVPLRDRGRFLATLTAEERRVLDRALLWYGETFMGN